MQADRRQRVLLAVLMVLLAIVVFRQLDGWLGGSGEGRSRKASARLRAQGSEIEIVDLRIEDLDRQRGKYQPGRDPFRFGQPPERPRPEPVERPRAQPQRQPQSSASRPSAPRPPTIDLVYLGNFGPADRRIAVFSDGEEILNAMVGDVLKEQFEVVQIGYESADLGYIDFPDSPPARLAVGG